MEWRGHETPLDPVGCHCTGHVRHSRCAPRPRRVSAPHGLDNVFIGEIIVTITNALACVAVKDIDAAVLWYRQVLARPADTTPMPELAEWKFPGGGGLQVYALPERAGSCSCTLTISDIDLEASRLEKLGVATGAKMGEQATVFMVNDPDGNSIAFAQAPN